MSLHLFNVKVISPEEAFEVKHYKVNSSNNKLAEHVLLLEKGRKALPIGTIKEWKGGKYIKTAKGWIPHSISNTPEQINEARKWWSTLSINEQNQYAKEALGENLAKYANGSDHYLTQVWRTIVNHEVFPKEPLKKERGRPKSNVTKIIERAGKGFKELREGMNELAELKKQGKDKDVSKKYNELLDRVSWMKNQLKEEGYSQEDIQAAWMKTGKETNKRKYDNSITMEARRKYTEFEKELPELISKIEPMLKVNEKGNVVFKDSMKYNDLVSKYNNREDFKIIEKINDTVKELAVKVKKEYESEQLKEKMKDAKTDEEKKKIEDELNAYYKEDEPYDDKYADGISLSTNKKDLEEAKFNTLFSYETSYTDIKYHRHITKQMDFVPEDKVKAVINVFGHKAVVVNRWTDQPTLKWFDSVTVLDPETGRDILPPGMFEGKKFNTKNADKLVELIKQKYSERKINKTKYEDAIKKAKEETKEMREEAYKIKAEQDKIKNKKDDEIISALNSKDAARGTMITDPKKIEEVKNNAYMTRNDKFNGESAQISAKVRIPSKAIVGVFEMAGHSFIIHKTFKKGSSLKNTDHSFTGPLQITEPESGMAVFHEKSNYGEDKIKMDRTPEGVVRQFERWLLGDPSKGYTGRKGMNAEELKGAVNSAKRRSSNVPIKNIDDLELD